MPVAYLPISSIISFYHSQLADADADVNADAG